MDSPSSHNDDQYEGTEDRAPEDGAPEEGVMEIPWQHLSAEALDGVVGEFVSREGTDYGDEEYSFDDKKQAVIRQLQSGHARLLFDPVGNSCQIELTRVLANRGWISE
ncbi:MAG: YheU family protein [Oceanobacter sp.]